MVQIKQKKDGTYSLKMKGLSRLDLEFLQSLLGESDDIILERVNKYREEFEEEKFTAVPEWAMEIFLTSLDYCREEDNE